MAVDPPTGPLMRTSSERPRPRPRSAGSVSRLRRNHAAPSVDQLEQDRLPIAIRLSMSQSTVPLRQGCTYSLRPWPRTALTYGLPLMQDT